MKTNRKILLLFALATILVLLFIADLKIGGRPISLFDTFRTYINGDTGNTTTILMNIRLPKALAAIFTGAALSVSGAIMQIVFKNPLAGPYVLGVSSGASLAVAVVTMLASLTGVSIYALGNWTIGITAVFGTLVVMMAIVALSNKLNDSITILIIGVLFASLANAVICIIQYFSNPDSLKLFVNWTMGSLNAITWTQLQLIAPVSILCLIATLFLSKQLDAMLLGDIYATTMGISVRSFRNCCILITSILAGLTTAFTGPIGFIGIAVPHLTRGLLNTTRHLYVIPGSILTGAIILLGCDIVSQSAKDGYTLPINAICAIIGAPVVTFVIIKSRKNKQA